MTESASSEPVRRSRLKAIAGHSAVRYLFAGGLAFLFDFALLALLREVFHWPTWLAAGTAFILSFAFTYTIQRVFAFESDAPHGASLVKYATLVAFNTIATALIVWAIDHIGSGWIAGKVVATIVTTAWNYFIYKFWVFAGPARPTETED